MNDLVPEKRLDRVGKLVTRWVKPDTSIPKKNSILGTIMPTLSPAAGNYIKDYAQSDKENRKRIIDTLRIEIQRDFANQREVKGKTGQARYKAINQLQDRLDKMVPSLHAFDTSTLQVLADTPCSKYSLINFVMMQSHSSPEAEFRERMHYMVVEDGIGALHKRDFFTKVKNALDVDDLSTFPRDSVEHEVTSAALYLLDQDWARRHRNRDAPKEMVDDDYMRELMGFLMQQPEKAVLIQRFVRDRNVSLDEVDLTLLDEYLNAPIPVIADGLL